MSRFNVMPRAKSEPTDWTTGIVYELTVRSDNKLIAHHRFKPNCPAVDRDLEDLTWQIKQTLKQRGLER